MYAYALGAEHGRSGMGARGHLSVLEVVDQQGIALHHHGGRPPGIPGYLSSRCVASVDPAVVGGGGTVVAQLDGPVGIKRVALPARRWSHQKKFF